RQLQRGGPLPGFFQPVEIKSPPGSLVSMAAQGRFEEPLPAPRKVGLLIGSVYRLRVTGIRLAQGQEVFPTIEIVDRLYAPIGQTLRFPIRIELTKADLKLALAGKFVTRVIYVEDPGNALPASSAGERQNWFDLRPGEDPLATADVLGRPAAILRMGGRVPSSSPDIDPGFLAGCPPFRVYPSEEPTTSPHPLPLSQSERGVVAGQAQSSGGDQEVKFLPAPGADSVVKVLPPKNAISQVKVLPPPKNNVISRTAAILPCPRECPERQQNTPLPEAAYPPWAPPGISRPWPVDEYICDGGDSGVGACLGKQQELRGLEMEDTIGVYKTIDGRTLVTPSNKVCIYSPRFCSVRQVVGLVETEQRDRISDVSLNMAVATPSLTQKVDAANQQVRIERQISARPAQAFRMKQGDGAMSSVIGARGFQNGFKPYENLAVLRLGQYDNGEMMMLARGAQAAAAWNHDQAVQIILDRKGAMATVQNQGLETIFVATVPPGKPKLRIIKVASTPYAQAGEEVWFTIRFDNVGNQTIGNVTIIDSLSPRLEYVAGSAQCSRDAKFSTQPNEGDSLVVRAEISAPLKPGQGGIVRFCCKVR
ncbi:MAG: hypothetical protein ACWGMZ_07610, partial [Thermoguttaceae bacterium]